MIGTVFKILTLAIIGKNTGFSNHETFLNKSRYVEYNLKNTIYFLKLKYKKCPVIC